MRPEMKRELLLALDAMLNGRNYTGTVYRAEKYNSDGSHHLARVQVWTNGWCDLVFLGNHGRDTPKDEPLRAGWVRHDPGFLWIVDQLGTPELYSTLDLDWDSNILAGLLGIAAFRVAVREALANNPEVA